MTVRILAIGVVTVALMVGGWMAGVASASRTPLRSAHSEPARSVPAGTVAVTEHGKLFHDPSCTLIHGPVHLESGSDAALGGYTPCTRCLPAE